MVIFNSYVSLPEGIFHHQSGHPIFHHSHGRSHRSNQSQGGAKCLEDTHPAPYPATWTGMEQTRRIRYSIYTYIYYREMDIVFIYILYIYVQKQNRQIGRQIRLDQIRLDQIRLDQIRLEQIRLDRWIDRQIYRIGQDRIGQDRIDQIRLDRQIDR